MSLRDILMASDYPGANRYAWMADAACRGLAQLMFPDQYDVDGQMAAKAVCAKCPVKDTCLEHALTNNETFGIWGGASERERRKIRRRRRASRNVSPDLDSMTTGR